MEIHTVVNLFELIMCYIDFYVNILNSRMFSDFSKCEQAA